MKHQYFGDVNDYVKYGLLRCFAEAGFQVGVCWMLTPNDGRPDGRKIMYLSRPEKWKCHDPTLFAALSEVVAKPNGRHIRHIKTRGLNPRAQFFSNIVPDHNAARHLV